MPDSLHFLIHLTQVIIFRLIFIYLQVLSLVSIFFPALQVRFFKIQNYFDVIHLFLLGKVYHVIWLLIQEPSYFIIFLSAHALTIAFCETMIIIKLLRII